jgi:hypothetical protein
MPARAESVASDALLGAGSIEVDGTKPRPVDVIEGPCQDLVMCGSGPGMPRCTVLGDMVPGPTFSGVIDPGVTELGLLGSLGSVPPSINWEQVEDNVEQACLKVAAMDMLLGEALAMVGLEIL